MWTYALRTDVARAEKGTSEGSGRSRLWQLNRCLDCSNNCTVFACCISSDLMLQNSPARFCPTHARGLISTLRRSSSPVHRLQALMLDSPPMPPPADTTSNLVSEAVEQADELIEEFIWARGLIPAGECFEQFGWTESAPPLKDIRQPVTDDQRRALASCLATPFMYEEEHLSRQAQESVKDRTQEEHRRLTSR